MSTLVHAICLLGVFVGGGMVGFSIGVIHATRKTADAIQSILDEMKDRK